MEDSNQEFSFLDAPLSILEFPEFLSVFFSNLLKSFTKVEIRIVTRAFFVKTEIPE